MCAVRHPDKLRELDTSPPAASTQPAATEPKSRRNGNGTAKLAHGGNGKPRVGVGHRKRAVLLVEEKRLYPRLPLNLPLRLRRIAGQPPATNGHGLWTEDISSCGVRFQAAHEIELDVPVELEVELVNGPLGGRHLQMVTLARIVRSGPGKKPGWQEFGAQFEEITFNAESPAEISAT